MASSMGATLKVPVFKGDGSIRICGDYKQTVTKAAEMWQIPYPKNRRYFCYIEWGVRGGRDSQN